MPEFSMPNVHKIVGRKIVSYTCVKSDNNLYNSAQVTIPDTTAHMPKALIIDDEADICYLLGSILRQKNFQTAYAGSISEAEKILAQESDHDIIFLDNHLPDGLGVNYLIALKKRYPASTVIMITAHDTVADRQKARDRGVDHFIGKPFSKEIIFNTIENVIR